jgi:bifunctional non-homologous end joining protein LigD
MLAPPLADLTPMLLAEANQARADDEVICELKWDDYRLLAEVRGAHVALQTRGGADATGWYPELARDLVGLSSTRVVLDGEVVVLDALGRSDFERLHARSRRRGWYTGADAVVFVAFDVLVH